MNKIKKIAPVILLLLIAAGGYMYYYTFHKPHKNTFDLKADYSMPASALYSEFENNEEASNKKYLGKILEVTGEIVNINKFDGNYEISLQDEMEGVTCMIDSVYAIQQKGVLNKLNTGDNVKIKGQCNGFLMGVKMDRCVLVDDSE